MDDCSADMWRIENNNLLDEENWDVMQYKNMLDPIS